MLSEVFISGGTGYIGAPLAAKLALRGHSISTIARSRSLAKVPSCVIAVRADALRAETFMAQVPAASTFVHLTGTPHPAPWKAEQFRRIDLASLQASLAAALHARIAHFVYVSVAHPAPVMKAYIEVRSECERIIAQSGLNATVLRPWYVLGPGHWWPVVLKPVYVAARFLPAFRDAAQRLGLVNRSQMVAALVSAVENPVSGMRILEVSDIKRGTHAQSRVTA